VFNVIQKFTPSLQAPYGNVLAPVETDPIGERSAAFQSETLSPTWLVTRTLCPSNAAVAGTLNPFPVSGRFAGSFERGLAKRPEL
jgi:hypothetical protein